IAAVVDMRDAYRAAHIAAEALIPCRNIGRIFAGERVRPGIESRVAVLIVEADVDLISALSCNALRAVESRGALRPALASATPSATTATSTTTKIRAGAWSTTTASRTA